MRRRILGLKTIVGAQKRDKTTTQRLNLLLLEKLRKENNEHRKKLRKVKKS